MSRFTLSKLSLFRGEEINSKYNFQICMVDNENTEVVNNAMQLKQIKLTVEELFELTFEIKQFADELKQTEIEKTKNHIEVLEERLSAAKQFLEQLERM